MYMIFKPTPGNETEREQALLCVENGIFQAKKKNGFVDLGHVDLIKLTFEEIKVFKFYLKLNIIYRDSP